MKKYVVITIDPTRWISSTRGPVYSSHNYKARRFSKAEAEKIAAQECRRTGLCVSAVCVD